MDAKQNASKSSAVGRDQLRKKIAAKKKRGNK